MKTAVTISIEKDFLKKLRASAAAERRTLSAQIEFLCNEKLNPQPSKK